MLKSFSQQYAAQGLKVNVEMTSPDPKIFESEAFRNALTDLDLRRHQADAPGCRNGCDAIALHAPNGEIAGEWKEFDGPVPLGLALRKVFGEPIYAQMDVSGRE